MVEQFIGATGSNKGLRSRRVRPFKTGVIIFACGACGIPQRLGTRIRRDVLTVYFAARDPDTPLLVRALACLVASYALSPIDLIPDFIPVFGYLDDLLIVPVGLIIVVRLLPADVLERSRAKAIAASEHPSSWTAGIIIVSIWLLFAAGLTYIVLARLNLSS